MNKIRLTVPALDPVANPKTLTRPDTLREAIEALPAADPAAMAMAMLKLLQPIVRHPGDLSQLLPLLEAFLPPLGVLIAKVREITLGRTAVNRRSQELIGMVEQLADEIGYGFKRAVNDIVLAPGRRQWNTADARILYWALDAMALDVMLRFSCYRPEHRTVWREIMQIYLLAKELGLSREAIPDPTAIGEGTATIGLALRRILLVSLADPFKLHRGEVWIVYDCLTCWAGRVALGPYAAAQKAAGRFLIDRRGFEKPKPFDPDKLPTNDTQLLLLNALPLNATVHEQLKVVQSGNAATIPPLKSLNYWSATRILQSMLLGWHVLPSRRHERAERYDWLISTCGIGSVHHYLQTSAADEGEADEMEATLTDSQVDIGSTSLGITAAIHHRFRCRQTNISASGVCLIMAPEDAQGIHVGQIMVLESERERGVGRSKLAVIRRMIHRDASSLEVGLRFLPGEVRTARIELSSQSRSDRQPALLIRRNGSGESELITPSLVYQPYRRFLLHTRSGDPMEASAGKLIESTCCFDRFECRFDP